VEETVYFMHSQSGQDGWCEKIVCSIKKPWDPDGARCVKAARFTACRIA